MSYSALPPEVNSGRMYAGPGSGSLRAAAAAWQGLASELQMAASSYSSVIDGLTCGVWVGPSSVRMAAAVSPYLAWMQTTATQAGEAAVAAMAAACAYEAAFAAHVAPAQIAANRSQLAQLVATNIVGQNTPAIAATELEYAAMWAQDATAMDTYASSSATAADVTPFAQAPQTTAATGLQSLLTEALDPLDAGNPVVTALANLSSGYTNTLNTALNDLFGPGTSALYSNVYNAVKVPLGFTTGFNDIGLLTNFPVSQYLKFAPPIPYAALPKDALGAGLGALGFGRGTLYGSVSGAMGNAGTLVGKLSVPPSWAAATPAVRMVAALSAAGPEAVTATALSGLLSSTSVAGMLGSALGAGAPGALGGARVRGRVPALKELKNTHSPEKLRRLVAQIAEEPDSVQHHTVDQQGLDGLLEQLSKKRGVHAVHVKRARHVVPTDAQLG